MPAVTGGRATDRAGRSRATVGAIRLPVLRSPRAVSRQERQPQGAGWAGAGNKLSGTRLAIRAGRSAPAATKPARDPPHLG